MSEVTGTSGYMNAGNTNETLRPIDVFDAVSQTAKPSERVEVVTYEPSSFSETVTYAEFAELQDAFLRLADRIDTFNLRSPHRI